MYSVVIEGMYISSPSSESKKMYKWINLKDQRELGPIWIWFLAMLVVWTCFVFDWTCIILLCSWLSVLSCSWLSVSSSSLNLYYFCFAFGRASCYALGRASCYALSWAFLVLVWTCIIFAFLSVEWFKLLLV